MDNTIFQDYLLEVASNIDSLKDTELSRKLLLQRLQELAHTHLRRCIVFFAALPCLLQSDIIDYVKGNERMKDRAHAHIRPALTTTPLMALIRKIHRHAWLPSPVRLYPSLS